MLGNTWRIIVNKSNKSKNRNNKNIINSATSPFFYYYCSQIGLHEPSLKGGYIGDDIGDYYRG